MMIRLSAVYAVLALAACPNAFGALAGFDDHTDVGTEYNAGSGQLTAVDQYIGQAGDGWITAWQVDNNASSQRKATVKNVDELVSGSGNYVEFRNVDDVANTATNRQIYHTREYDASMMITQQVVSFLYRPDDTDAFKGGGATFIEIMDADARFSRNQTWGIRSLGGTTKRWGVIDGDGTGSISNNVDTGMSILEDHVYKFVLNVSPLDQSWRVTIRDLTASTSVTMTDLGFVDNRTTLVGELMFGVQVAGQDLENQIDATYTFSLDSVSVVVPAPTALPAGLVLIGLAAIRRRK